MSKEEETWSIAVDGESIAKLDEKDRWAKIIEPAPAYTKDEQAPNAEKQRIKLILFVELSDGRKAQYYMNRTSARKVASILKTDLSVDGLKKWVGHKVVWGKVLDQIIAGQEKKVLYVTDAIPTEDVVATEKPSKKA